MSLPMELFNKVRCRGGQRL